MWSYVICFVLSTAKSEIRIGHIFCRISFSKSGAFTDPMQDNRSGPFSFPRQGHIVDYTSDFFVGSGGCSILSICANQFVINLELSICANVINLCYHSICAINLGYQFVQMFFRAPIPRQWGDILAVTTRNSGTQPEFRKCLCGDTMCSLVKVTFVKILQNKYNIYVYIFIREY
jgi:hypothetical protein